MGMCWVVLVWKEAAPARACLASLMAQHVPAPVLVVDNGSPDHLGAELQQAFPEVEVLRLGRNAGVAGGRNAGLDWARRRGFAWVAFLDDDATAAPDATAAWAEAARRLPGAAVLGAKVRLPDGSGRLWRAGCTHWRHTFVWAPLPLLQRALGAVGLPLPPWLDCTRGQGRPDHPRWQKDRRMAFHFGGAMAGRVDILVEIGGFDPRFNPYGGEDIDLGLRLCAAGHEVWYVPTVTLFHPDTGSWTDPWWRAFQNARNVGLLMRRHSHPALFWGVWLPEAALVQAPLRAVDALLRRQPRRWAGWAAGILWNLDDIRRHGLRPPLPPAPLPPPAEVSP
jgi:GT2 family glycosyltransferase